MVAPATGDRVCASITAPDAPTRSVNRNGKQPVQRLPNSEKIKKEIRTLIKCVCRKPRGSTGWQPNPIAIRVIKSSHHQASAKAIRPSGSFNQRRSCWLRYAPQQYTLYCCATSSVFASIKIFKTLSKTSALLPIHHDTTFNFKDERVHPHLIAFDVGVNPVEPILGRS